ncbi:response regulator [Deinococcus sonorensis]|uniref:Response regulator n=2 Tax=Deinococcus sonorensis TaxID=309891 RepID=A0AAU7U6U0_9DEIO
MHHAPDLLLIEDDAAAARMVEEAVREVKPVPSMVHVASAEAALAYLERFPDHPPRLILLDLQLPSMSGMELLERLKAHSHHRLIPVVILSLSDLSGDILSSYDHQASGYLHKPATFPKLILMLQALSDFWFQTVRLVNDRSM